MDYPEFEKAAFAGFDAAITLVNSLGLTDDEVATALFAAAQAMEVISISITRDMLLGYKIRPEKVLGAALAAALASVHTRDEMLKKIGDN